MFIPVKYLVFILWLMKTVLGDSLIKPLILNEVPKYCQYTIAQKPIEFWSKLHVIYNGHFKIFMNLCSDIPEEYCGKNLKFCIKDERTNSTFLIGDEFVSGQSVNLLLASPKSEKCKKKNTPAKVTINFLCLNDVEKPRLLALTDCEFEIQLLKPNCKDLFCGTWIRSHWLDLTPLQGNYIVSSKNDYNFSVGVCMPNSEPNYICKGDGVTSCDITKGLMPLATRNTEIIEYLPNDNEIRIHSSHKEAAFRKKITFKMTLKCDWTKLSPELQYIKPEGLQGRFYTFEMKTRLGCVKIPHSCEFLHHNLKYDLTSLNKGNYWSVAVDKNTQIKLNICGPLFDKEDSNDCSRSFSQVCEITNQNTFVNKGSIQKIFDGSDDGVISTSFIYGATCKNDSTKQYQTQIDLLCGDWSDAKIELVSSGNCETRLKWISPTACPEYETDESHCDYTAHTVLNCTVEIDNYFYNLTTLTRKKNNKYIVEDKDNSSISYLLNMCGPVMENPCRKDVMIAIAHVNEINIKKREVSLGQFNRNRAYRENNALVIETSGEMCREDPSKYLYYKSLIHLECTGKEEGPKLLKKTNCTYEFIWKTPVSCPKTLKNPERKECTYKNSDDQKEINLRQLRHTLKVNISGLIHIFDLCDDGPQCSNKEFCVDVPSNNLTYVNKTLLEFTVNKPCTSVGQFNKIQFQLVCDQIINNDHFEFTTWEDCTMKFEFRTHLVCSQNDLVISVANKHKVEQTRQEENVSSDNSQQENKVTAITPGVQNISKQSNKNIVNIRDAKAEEAKMKKLVTTAVNNIHQNVDCSVMNQYTGFHFNISKLNLNISSHQCPSYSFGYENKITNLTYSLSERCPTISGEFKNITYIVSLKCSERNIQYSIPVNKACEKWSMFEQPEFCKLLERSEFLSAGSVTGIVLGLVGVLLIGLSGYICYKKRKIGSYQNLDHDREVEMPVMCSSEKKGD